MSAQGIEKIIFSFCKNMNLKMTFPKISFLDYLIFESIILIIWIQLLADQKIGLYWFICKVDVPHWKYTVIQLNMNGLFAKTAGFWTEIIRSV